MPAILDPLNAAAMCVGLGVVLAVLRVLAFGLVLYLVGPEREID